MPFVFLSGLIHLLLNRDFLPLGQKSLFNNNLCYLMMPLASSSNSNLYIFVFSFVSKGFAEMKLVSSLLIGRKITLLLQADDDY